MDCGLVNYQWFLSEVNEVQIVDKQQLIKWIATILTTLNEVSPTEPIAASTIYLAMGMNIADYDLIKGCLLHCDWIVTTSETIALTDKGRAKAIDIEQTLTRNAAKLISQNQSGV